MTRLRVFFLAWVVVLVTACGDSGELGTVRLSLHASLNDIKEISFTWPAYAGATYYRLLHNPDGASGYSQVGGDITATQMVVTIPAHNIDWINARYMLEAYDAGGRIASSSAISITSFMLDAIGYLKASNTGFDDQFGYRVAVSGNGTTLAIAAIGEDSNATGIDQSGTDAANDAGAIYLFIHDSSGWSQQAYIKASNTGAGDGFGDSVALSSDGNTLAVGAAGEDSSSTSIGGNQSSDIASNAGAVYLFTRSGTIWNQQAYIKASNSGAGDGFGGSVALSSDGNTLAVGAAGEDSNATGIGGNQSSDMSSNAGAVYLFIRSGTTWSQQAYIKASNTGSSDGFGNSVALGGDGNTLAVGATGEDSSATGIGGIQASDLAFEAGAVYLFTRSGTTWSQQAYLKASNTGSGDGFGGSVALSSDGNTLAVGASGEDSGATGIDGNQNDDIASDAGAAYLFTRSGTTWSQQAYIKASNSEANDTFGTALALSSDGNLLAVSAPNEDSSAIAVDGAEYDNSASSSGALYLYRRSGTVWGYRHYLKAPNSEYLDQFGFSLGLSGDGNTLLIGATGEDSSVTGIGGNQGNNNMASSGAAYLF